MKTNEKQLIIYVISDDGRGVVKEFTRIPIEELVNGTYNLPIRLFREDVLLSFEIEEVSTKKEDFDLQ